MSKQRTGVGRMSLIERQLKWLLSQCECETLDGMGMCPACGIAVMLQQRRDNARRMQTMAGEWVWAIKVDANEREQ